MEMINWNELWLTLMARSHYILHSRYSVNWNTQKRNEFSRNLIGEVFEKIFVSKTRKWNTTSYPEFDQFIIGAIDSDINNFFKTYKKAKKEVSLDVDNTVLKIADKTTSIEDEIDANSLRKEITDELISLGADDSELLIFECLSDGMSKPSELREYLGITKSDFHNIWRKFKRRRVIIQQKFADRGHK